MNTITNDVALPQARKSARRWMVWIGGALGGLLILGAVWFAFMMRTMADENTPPPNLDVSRTRVSTQGLYRGTYTPTLDPIAMDKLHAWTLHLETVNGQPVKNATITVHGDMPGHGHGLPTQPIATQQGNGDYLIEGMKFQMHGWWYVEFDVSAGGKQDTVRFDFVLR